MKQFTRRNWFALIAILGLIPLQASGAERPLQRPTSFAEVWSRTELYFGSQKVDGTSVSDEEFSQFVNDVITEKFPDGLTLLTGYGQFKNSSGTIVRERSFVLILFYPPLTIDANRKIQEIREAYKKAFGQESVLRADSYSMISF